MPEATEKKSFLKSAIFLSFLRLKKERPEEDFRK